MPPKKKVKKASLEGEVCVFSGFRDTKLEELINAAGGEVSARMSKSVSMIVCKSTSNLSATVKDAVARGAKIISKEDLEMDLQQATPAVSASSGKTKVASSTKKSGSVSHQLGCVDIVAETILRGSRKLGDLHVVKENNDIFDVELVLIDLSQNMDKFYIIQLIISENHPTEDDEFYVFVKWGRTGSPGQTQVRNFDDFDDAKVYFEEKFFEKTNNKWSDKHSFVKHAKHYDMLVVNHSYKQTSSASTTAKATWEYFVDDFVDGKSIGWYPFAPEGAGETEKLWVSYQSNHNMSVRIVQSGHFSYNVDLVQMTQTNVSHPNAKKRSIRRTQDGNVTQASVVISHAAAAATTATSTFPNVPAVAPTFHFGTAPTFPSTSAAVSTTVSWPTGGPIAVSAPAAPSSFVSSHPFPILKSVAAPPSSSSSSSWAVPAVSSSSSSTTTAPIAVVTSAHALPAGGSLNIRHPVVINPSYDFKHIKNGWTQVTMPGEDSPSILVKFANNSPLTKCEEILGFDIDGTIITTKSGAKFAKSASDWEFLYPTIPQHLSNYVASKQSSTGGASAGVCVFFITNQNGVSKGHTTIDEITTKFDNIIQQIGVPVDILCSLEDDINRKPRLGGFKFLLEHKFGVRSIFSDVSNSNVVKCTYVGDAAGRPKTSARGKDFSASDYEFSLNANIGFLTPEQFFQDSKLPLHCDRSLAELSFSFQEYMASLTVSLLKEDKSIYDPPPDGSKEIVLLVGPPASGKSTIARTRFKDYERANQDLYKTRSKCMQVARNAILNLDKHVVVDNTSGALDVRREWIDFAKTVNASIRCIRVDIPKDVCFHLATFRELDSATPPGDKRSIPSVVVHTFFKNVVEPKVSEGFRRVDVVQFAPDVPADEESRKLLFSYL